MKIFSKKKFIEVMGENVYESSKVLGQSWVDICDNQPVVNNKIKCDEESNYDIKDEWCVEI